METEHEIIEVDAKSDTALTPRKVSKEVRNDSVEGLIARAIDQGVPVETMERLLAMRRELKAERAKEEYDKAMAKFQADCPIIQKTKVVKTKSGDVAYKYAPIESIVAQVQSLLEKHGFSYRTSMELYATGVRVTVRVTHRAGHSEECPMDVPFGNQTQVMSQSQVAAAAQTFAKRYAFCNAFGILTGDEDTDGANLNTAVIKKGGYIQHTDPQPEPKAPTPQAQSGMSTILSKIAGMRLDQYEEYRRGIEQMNISDNAKKALFAALEGQITKLKESK